MTQRLLAQTATRNFPPSASGWQAMCSDCRTTPACRFFNFWSRSYVNVHLRDFFCNVLFWKFVSLCIAFGKDQIIIWFYPYQNIEKEIFWDLLRMLFQNVYTSVCILWLMILNVRRDLHEIQKVLFTDFTRLSGFWNAQRVPKQIWQGGYANGWTSIGAFDRGEASNQPVKD